MEVELDNVRNDQEKTKGQIRRKDTKLLQKRIESLEAAPPTGPLHVVLWEDNSMLPTDCSLFLLREPSRIDVSHICRWRLLVCIWTAQRGSVCEDSGEATHSVSGSAAVAYYMHTRYSEAYDTVGLLCKAGGTDAFRWGAWPRDTAVDTHRQAGRRSTALTGASSRSCHVTKRFRILATLKQGNKSMYSNTSGYVHMGLRLDWGKGIIGQ